MRRIQTTDLLFPINISNSKYQLFNTFASGTVILSFLSVIRLTIYRKWIDYYVMQ